MDPDSLKVPELKAELQRRGLDTHGLKPELLVRLKAAIASDVSSAPLNDVPISAVEENEHSATEQNNGNSNHTGNLGEYQSNSTPTDNTGSEYVPQQYEGRGEQLTSEQEYNASAASNGDQRHESSDNTGGENQPVEYPEENPPEEYPEENPPQEYDSHADYTDNPSSQESSDVRPERVGRYRSESPDASRSPHYRGSSRDRDYYERDDSRSYRDHRRSDHRRSRDDDDESVSSREPDEKRRRVGGALDLSSSSSGPFVVDPEGWWQSTTVQLDRFFSDLNLVLDSDGYRAKTLNEEGFGMMMGGVKASYGVPITNTSTAKVAFEIKVLRLITPSSIHQDEKPRHVLRIGYSNPDVSPNRLADDKFSFAFDCRGRIIKGPGDSKEFGSKCTETDVITILLDLSDPEFVYVDIMRNGDRMPFSSSSSSSHSSSTAAAPPPASSETASVNPEEASAEEGDVKAAEPESVPAPPPPVTHAFTFNRGELLSGATSMTLFPHILLKNVSIECNFGQKSTWFPLPEGYVMLNDLPLEERVRNPLPPTSKADCEVLMMCGLPSAGKTFWVNKMLHERSEMRFNALGVSYVLDAMRLDDRSRRRVHRDDHRGKTCDLIDIAMRCLNRLMEAAAIRPRNYILDQTNVYTSTQRRKMTMFNGFKRRAIVVVPSDEEYQRRVQERERVEGRDIPYDAILEMRAGFQLPSLSDNYYESIDYVELNEEEAREVVRKYNEDGKRELAKVHEREEELAISRGDYHHRGRNYDDSREYRSRPPYDRFDRRGGDRFGRGGYDSRDRGDRRDYYRGDRRRFRNSDEPEQYRETEFERYRARGPPPPPPRFGYDRGYDGGGGGGYRGRGFRGGPRGGGFGRGGGDFGGGRGRGRDGQGLLPAPHGPPRGGWNGGGGGGGHWDSGHRGGGGGEGGDGHYDNRGHRGQPDQGPGGMRGGHSAPWHQRGPPQGNFQQPPHGQPNSGFGPGNPGFRPPGDRPPRQSRWSSDTNPSGSTVPPVASSTQHQPRPAQPHQQQSGQYATPVSSSYQGGNASYQQPNAPQYGGYQPPTSGNYPPSQQQHGQSGQQPPQQQWSQWNQQQQQGQQTQPPQWQQQQQQQQQTPQQPFSSRPAAPSSQPSASAAPGGQGSSQSWSASGGSNYNYPSNQQSQQPPQNTPSSSASGQPPQPPTSQPNQQGWTAAQQQWWQQYGAQWQQQMAQAAQQGGSQSSSASQNSQPAPPPSSSATASMNPQQQQAYQQQWAQWQQYYSQYAAAAAAAAGGNNAGAGSTSGSAQPPPSSGAPPASGTAGTGQQPPTSTANPWANYNPGQSQSSYGR